MRRLAAAASARPRPVAEVVALMLFRHVPQSLFLDCVEKNAEAMSKYIMYNFRTQWPETYRSGLPTQREGERLLQGAGLSLSTEERDAVCKAMDLLKSTNSWREGW